MTPRKPITPARLALEALLLAGVFFTLGTSEALISEVYETLRAS